MLDDVTKKTLSRELNFAIGVDITNLANAIDAENELVHRRNQLQSCLNVANDEVPTKLYAALKLAEKSSERVNQLKNKNEAYRLKVEHFLKRIEPVRTELSEKFATIERLEEILDYLKSLEKVEEINRTLTACSDDEQAVLLYNQLQEMCELHTAGHRALYFADNARHWHNVLKEKLSNQYEDVLKAMKWPIATGHEPYTPPREVLTKFSNLTKYLLLIHDPAKQTTTDTECEPSLPVRILLRPLKKRFAFHFTGPRQTARIDRPEWFLTQTLTWIKDHKAFIKNNIQPIADKLEVKGIKAEEEFNAALVSLAAERLHTVIGLYNSPGKGVIDTDAAFAHAVDEALGFHRELAVVTGKEINTVLSVLTKAETFVRWLAVEKKYALQKMDETLSSSQWMEAVGAGVGAAAGTLLWVPRGAEWFVTLLRTVEDRYTGLPQPGHRLQFLELQLELVEEWRVRLTQLMSASYDTLGPHSFLTPDASPHPLTAVINAGHHTRSALLQWAHSLHYLQLHYYRRQFQHFTEMQHSDEPLEPEPVDMHEGGVLSHGRTRTEYLLVEGDTKNLGDVDNSALEVVDKNVNNVDKHVNNVEKNLHTEHKNLERVDSNVDKSLNTVENDMDENLSLIEVEDRAKSLALNEVRRQDSLPLVDLANFLPMSPLMANSEGAPLALGAEAEDSGVFGELPSLLAHLRDAGLTTLADHMLLEFKAGLRDYKRQKWHAMAVTEERALSISTSLCRPLAELCARLHSARAKLAPSLCAKLRAHVAAELDIYLFEEVVMQNWWNSGGTSQFTHDVKRNLVPVFAPPDKPTAHNLPRLCEACKILNMDYDDAQRLRTGLMNNPTADQVLPHGVRHIMPLEVLQILNQRTDLNDNRTNVINQSLMEYF